MDQTAARAETKFHHERLASDLSALFTGFLQMLGS